jgi:hypothetical protein
MTYGFALFALAFFPLDGAARPAGLRFGLLLVTCLAVRAHFAGLSRARRAPISAMILSVLALVFYNDTPFLRKELVATLHPARGTRKTVHGFIALGVTFERLPLLGWAVTLLFVFVGWLYFFYPVTEATRMLRLLFTP